MTENEVDFFPLRVTGVTATGKRRFDPTGTAMTTAGFVPLQLAPAPTVAPEPGAIEMKVRRGATTVTARWPLSAAGDCGAWLQGWLR